MTGDHCLPSHPCARPPFLEPPSYLVSLSVFWDTAPFVPAFLELLSSPASFLLCAFPVLCLLQLQSCWRILFLLLFVFMCLYSRSRTQCRITLFFTFLTFSQDSVYDFQTQWMFVILLIVIQMNEYVFWSWVFVSILSCLYRKEPQSQNLLQKVILILLTGLPKSKQIMTILSSVDGVHKNTRSGKLGNICEFFLCLKAHIKPSKGYASKYGQVHFFWSIFLLLSFFRTIPPTTNLFFLRMLQLSEILFHYFILLKYSWIEIGLYMSLKFIVSKCSH